MLDPKAATIRAVLDNPNTHALGALFATFTPEGSWRLARRPESHSTPEHASWLHMAGLGLSVPARQCLDRRLVGREVVTGGVGLGRSPGTRPG